MDEVLPPPRHGGFDVDNVEEAYGLSSSRRSEGSMSSIPQLLWVGFIAVPVVRADVEAVTEAYVGFAEREGCSGGNGSRKCGTAEERGMRVSDPNVVSCEGRRMGNIIFAIT